MHKINTACAGGATWLRMLLVALAFCLNIEAAEVIPAAPKRYFNDFTGTISQGTVQRLNTALENLEKESSSQVAVVIYPKMQSESSIEDYTVRVAQSWGFGQRDKKNGAILFVFLQDRTMRLEVGYGLEGAIPDALAKRIIEDEIIPHFRSGNFDAGLSAGVTAIIQAAKGEYKGTGRTNAQGRRNRNSGGWVPLLIIAFMVIVSMSRRNRAGRMYGGRGWGGGTPWIGGGGWGGGSGWSGGGGGSSGGWLSGGSGGFGGGGASGKW